VQISITARQCEILPGVRQFAQQRLEKLSKYANDIKSVHVIVRHERAMHVAEITLRVNGNELVVTQEHAEAGAAIELAADRIEEQLRRLKDRRLDRTQRPSGEKGASGAAPAAADEDAYVDEESWEAC
jgi:putative sigma-54 modulation protein